MSPQAEQKTILDTVSAYFDYIFKTKNESFNLSNVNLFERQVESDSARLQKGEITLTDLAQSESSLAGAKANLIKANTELFTSKTNFQRVTGEKIPKFEDLEKKALLQLPTSLNSSLKLPINEAGNKIIIFFFFLKLSATVIAVQVLPAPIL